MEYSCIGQHGTNILAASSVVELDNNNTHLLSILFLMIDVHTHILDAVEFVFSLVSNSLFFFVF